MLIKGQDVGNLVNDDTLSGALTTAATVTSNVGDYAITQGTLAASDNYAITYVGANLSVTPRPLTVTYTANPASRSFGDPNPALSGSVSSSGLVNDDELGGTAGWTTTPLARGTPGWKWRRTASLLNTTAAESRPMSRCETGSPRR